MPFESQPYAPPVLYDSRRSTDATTALMLRQGDIAARGAAAQGDIWGNVVANLGAQAGDYLHQRSEQKIQQKREQAFNEALNTFDPTKPMEGFKRFAAVAGPEAALKYTNGLIGFAKLGQQPEDPEAFRHAVDGAATMLNQPNGEQMLASQWSTLKPLLDQGAKQRGLNLEDQYKPEYAGLIKDYAKQYQDTEHVDAGDRIVILNKHTGAQVGEIQKTVPTKVDTRSIDEQAAAAKLEGNNEKYNSLIKIKKQLADAGREPKSASEKLIPVQTQDASGNAVTTFITQEKALAIAEGKADPITKAASAATQSRRDAARAGLTAGTDLIAELDSSKGRAAVGAIMGRYNSLLDAAGAGNQEASYLVGKLKSYSALQPGIHGMRSAKMAQDIEDILKIKQDPDALIAKIKGINSAAEAMIGPQAGKPVDLGIPGVTVTKE